jgi:hypothetical protein
MKGVDIELLTMIWIYSALRATSTKNRLALLIAGLRWIGIFGFALLSGYFVTQDAYLESTISILTVLAWIAATTEALDLVLERYSKSVTQSSSGPPHRRCSRILELRPVGRVARPVLRSQPLR